MKRHNFSGKLDQFDLVDIIQMCCVSGRTGRLQVAQDRQCAVMYLQNGEVIHALCGLEEGTEAVYKILSWPMGRFDFEEGVQPTQHSTRGVGWEHLLMEGVRRRDELRYDLLSTDASADTPFTDPYLGSYYLCGNLQEDEHTRIYEAIQIFTRQKVLLHTLRPESQYNSAVMAKFVADANIKACIQHPSILTVYPIDEVAGVPFYARQFVDGVSLAALKVQGGLIDDAVALQFTVSVAEAFCYLAGDQIATSPLTASDLFLSHDGQARINNLATCANRTGTLVTPAQRDICALAHFVVDRLPNRTPQSVPLRSLFARMLQTGIDGYLDWNAVRQAVEVMRFPPRPNLPCLPKLRTDLAMPVSLTTSVASANSSVQLQDYPLSNIICSGERHPLQEKPVTSITSTALASTPGPSLLARFIRAWTFR